MKNKVKISMIGISIGVILLLIGFFLDGFKFFEFFFW